MKYLLLKLVYEKKDLRPNKGDTRKSVQQHGETYGSVQFTGTVINKFLCCCRARVGWRPECLQGI